MALAGGVLSGCGRSMAVGRDGSRRLSPLTPPAPTSPRRPSSASSRAAGETHPDQRPNQSQVYRSLAAAHHAKTLKSSDFETQCPSEAADGVGSPRRFGAGAVSPYSSRLAVAQGSPDPDRRGPSSALSDPSQQRVFAMHYPRRTSRIKRKRGIGFRARMRTRNGRKIINGKRRKGRRVNIADKM